jgi:hypothetical protein
MEDKYSDTIQKEIEVINRYLTQWDNLFSKEIKYYAEGWSVNLREKTIYPRYIVIFKEYNQNSFSIKSFEIHNNLIGKEHYKDLYFIDNITSLDALLGEIKNILYGKDILSSVKNEHFKT